MEPTQTLNLIANDLELLISRLLNSPYPFALWKNPQAETSFMMIDLLDESHSIASTEQSIETLHECFVVNSYSASHPPKPHVIKGDIILSIEKNVTEITFNPRLSSTDIESFVDFIQNSRENYFKQLEKISTPETDYHQSVQKAIKQINDGLMQKVVLARTKDEPLPANMNAAALFKDLSKIYPNAFCYLISSEEFGVWMGATPERLISISDQKTFVTDSLAGTQPLTEGLSLANIAWTQKEIEEQAMVSRYIIECFKKIRLREYEELGPKTVQAGNLAHLKSTFTVDMVATNSPLLGSTMLELLHPTSAVCGFPRAVANDFILENESFERKLFAGFLGPVNFQSQTRLFVNLRCMQLEPDKARLFAGAGITADSVPEKEFEETEHKMNTLLSVLRS